MIAARAGRSRHGGARRQRSPLRRAAMRGAGAMSGWRMIRTTVRPAAGLVSALLLLQGCMVGPDYVPPDTQMPDRWSQELSEGLSEGEADLRTWWTTLDDPALDRLIERATLGNLDIKQAVARIRQARAQFGIATGEIAPSVDAEGQVADQPGQQQRRRRGAAAGPHRHLLLARPRRQLGDRSLGPHPAQHRIGRRQHRRPDRGLPRRAGGALRRGRRHLRPDPHAAGADRLGARQCQRRSRVRCS